MRSIFGLIYTIFFLSCVTTALFVVFHLLRYSLNRKVAVFGTVFFLAVLAILLFTNALIFFTLPLETLFPVAF